MSAHASQPTEQQLKPMLANNQAMWVWFTKAATVGVVGVFVIVGPMAIFLLKH
jgi:hypothetical protein